MTNEELNKALYDKCDREFDAFLDEVNQAFTNESNGKYPLEYGDEFLSEYAYQYILYGDILMALEEIDLSDEQCKALLDNPNPLFSIYDEWLGTETDYMDRSAKAQMKYANKLGAEYTVMLGSNELESGMAKLKNMKDGSEEEIRLDELVKKFS